MVIPVLYSVHTETSASNPTDAQSCIRTLKNWGHKKKKDVQPELLIKMQLEDQPEEVKNI